MIVEGRKFDRQETKRFCNFSSLFYDRDETNNEQVIDWKMGSQTSSPATHLTVSTDGQINGRAALINRRFSIDRNILQSTQVSDLLIDPAIKGGACLMKLVGSYKIMETSFVFHTSNERSDIIYRDLFKFDVLCKLTAVAIPIRPFSLLCILASFSLLQRVAVIFDVFYQTVLRALIAAICLIGPRSYATTSRAKPQEPAFYQAFLDLCDVQFVRDADFLTWRYVDSPYDYQVITIKSRKEVLCQAYFRQVELEGKSAIVVLDVLSKYQPTTTVRMALYKALIEEGVRAYTDLVFFMYNENSSYMKGLVGFPFIKIPEKFLPHPTPVYWHSHQFPIDTDQSTKLYFSLGDLDYF